MRLLLDTVVLIWASTSPDRLSRRAAAALEERRNILELSSISLSEIAIKHARGKLTFSPDHIRQAVMNLDIRMLPFTADHAFLLFDLPLHHRDPFDRHLIAQAMGEEIAVVSPDQSFCLYRGLRTVW